MSEEAVSTPLPPREQTTVCNEPPPAPEKPKSEETGETPHCAKRLRFDEELGEDSSYIENTLVSIDVMDVIYLYNCRGVTMPPNAYVNLFHGYSSETKAYILSKLDREQNKDHMTKKGESQINHEIQKCEQ